MGNVKFFRALSAMVAVFFMALVVISCSDDQGAAKLPTLTNVITDTVALRDDLTAVAEVKVLGDTLSHKTETTNTFQTEHYVLGGFAKLRPQKDDYQIFEDQVETPLEFANNGRTGGKTYRQVLTDSTWYDMCTFAFPTRCGNNLLLTLASERQEGIPYLRPVNAEVTSIELIGTRALYKKYDSPVGATVRVEYELVGAKNDSTIFADLYCNYNRYVMAEDDIDHLELVSKGTKPVDPTTVSDSVKVAVVMKSGKKNEVVNYNVRKNEFTAITFDPDVVTDFSGYGFGHVIGISAFEAEKKVAERSTGNWSVYSKKDVYSAAIAGEEPFNTKYYLQTERAQYKDEKWGIDASFDYITPEVKEEGTNLNTVTSDRAGYDKAVVTNKVAVKYAGFTTNLSETKALYKEAKVERKIVDHGFDGTKTKKTWTPTTLTCKGVHFVLWNDGVREETTHEWTVNRILVNGPAFERVAKDNTNRTSKPSITDLKSSAKTHKDENKGNWSANEEKATIGSYVEMNGADNANLTWSATEYNDVVLKVGEDVLEFGHDVYDFTLTPNLGSGSVQGDYKVYPYTGKLSYVFGNATAKESTNTGKILVEEKTFFPKEWGKLKSVAQTTTISENTKKWDYVWSLHFYNENTKKYFVLPVILTYASPDVPVWNFNYVEECDKKSYDLYNSAYYYNGVKNAVGEDNREWMQWSIAATGSEKLAYGTIKYRTAADKAWDWESAVNGRATVFTHRYELKVTDGRLTVKDTYNGKAVTDSHCVNGGWK